MFMSAVTSPQVDQAHTFNGVGGIIGAAWLGAPLYMTDVYSTATVTGNNGVGAGGIAGWIENVWINRAYASGAINSTSAATGGIAGNLNWTTAP